LVPRLPSINSDAAWALFSCFFLCFVQLSFSLDCDLPLHLYAHQVKSVHVNHGSETRYLDDLSNVCCGVLSVCCLLTHLRAQPQRVWYNCWPNAQETPSTLHKSPDYWTLD
jgi:hypothetical protein